MSCPLNSMKSKVITKISVAPRSGLHQTRDNWSSPYRWACVSTLEVLNLLKYGNISVYEIVS